MLTRWILFHVASGQSFFSGVLCLLLASGLSPRATRGLARIGRNLLVGLGVILVATSATPLPLAGYAALVAITLAWLIAEAIPSRWPRSLLPLRLAAAMAWSGAAMFEAPYHVMPMLVRVEGPVLGIVGDSVTAGMDDPGVTTWPRVFAAQHRARVRDHSAVGATVGSAIIQAEALAPVESPVLLEIGGNDLLGGTPPEKFEADLERLLGSVDRAGRVVVMFELPLLPGSNAFGRIQRRLAAKHGVRLIPKRVLLGILLQGGSTLDSIHLSQEGHNRMAQAVWEATRWAFAHEE